jgi:signal transduction histidine kinase
MLFSEVVADPMPTASLKGIMESQAGLLCTLTGADGCVLFLFGHAIALSVETAQYTWHTPATPASSPLFPDSTSIVDRPQDAAFMPTEIAEAFPVYVAIYLPLSINEQRIGGAMLGYFEPRAITPEEIERGEQVAAQVSTAIAKAKLLHMEHLPKPSAEIQLQFSFHLMEMTTLVEATEALLSTVSQFADYDAGSVMLLDPDNSDVGYFAAVEGYTDPAEARHRTVYVSTIPHLAQMRHERKEIYFADVRGNKEWRPSHQPDPREVRSVLLVPLLSHQQTKMVGCLTLKSYLPDAFSQEVRSNIVLLCNQTATALGNLRLIEETQRRLNEVSILADISEALNRTVELDDMLQLILKRVMSLLNHSEDHSTLQGAVILRHELGDTLRLAVGYNLSDAYCNYFNARPFYSHDSTFAQSILHGEWVELNDPDEIAKRMQYTHPDLVVAELINIPLKSGIEVIGVIVANRVIADPMTRRLIRTIADLAGAAMLKTRLLSQARARAVELMEAHDTLYRMDQQRDEFIQNITHDLRAPLTFIRGYTDLMIEGAMGDINDEQREALEVIQERTEAVNRLVGDILKLKQIESQPLKEEPVELVAVATNAVRSAIMSARQAGLEIQFDQHVDHAIVLGDAGRLGQVFDNLLSNAIKYNRPGGKVLVQIERNEAKVIISISDTGIGIPEEELDRIWERYYRAHGTVKTYAGTGLGLANVRRIIEAHDGRIWVRSSHQGTTFTFEIPLSSENVQA